MKIDEIIGYHGHPATQAIKQAVTGPSRTSWGKLHDVHQKLKSMNYKLKYKGSGTRGIVFKRPNDPYVIKIFLDDPQYLTYVQYALKHQDNPHVPRLRGKIMRIYDEVYAVRIEELQPVKTEALNDHQKELLKTLITSNTFGELARDDYIKFEEPRLHELFRDLSDLYGKITRTDIITDNVMMRDNVFVITDPA